ncbi:MAG TPA: MFS transporter [Candidatus Binatia bacterium]|jgi:MFS family permease
MPLGVPSSLRHRRFLLLWFGLVVSMAGSQMQLAAIHWHIRSMSDAPNPMELGGIGLARILPVILFSFVGGPVADTWDRRRILLVTQTIMTGVAAMLAYLTFTQRVDLGWIYILTAVQAAALAFDLPARQAVIPNLVPVVDLPNAFSMSSIAFNVGAIAGPAAGGIVIARFGLAYAYLFNALSFLAVIAALVVIGPIEQDRKTSPGISLRAATDGARFILSRPVILSSMLLDFFATFFASANTMMPIVARDILHVGEVGYGVLVSAQSVGSVLAAAFVSQMSGIRRQGRTIVAAVVVFGIATVAFGLTSSFVFAVAALALMGAADAISTIIRNTIRQLQTPDSMRGRMSSISQIFFQGGPQLGEVEAGVVASLFGVPFAIVSGGIGTIVATLWLVARWPQLRLYEGTLPGEDVAA